MSSEATMAMGMCFLGFFASSPIDETDSKPTRHKIAIHPWMTMYIVIQGCIAILCLVGFESVSSMGEEAKNPKKHIPIAVVASLLIQGGFCYLFEYFAATTFRVLFTPT